MNNIQVGSIEHEELLLKTKDWRVLYPLYFDKKASRAGGRKVPKNLAVDTPDVEDLVQMLSYLKIPFVVEMNKRHPRDHFCVGRVRYNLQAEDGTFVNKDVQNSKFL
jgi:signal recognition particle subunit SRP19